MAEEDDAAIARYAGELVAAVDASLEQWIRTSVTRHLPTPTPGIERELTDASARARAEIGSALSQLLELDIDEQWTNPLSIIRRAAAYPTTILASAGVPPVERDPMAVRTHPDDVYDLVPLSFRELGEAVHEPGIVWGAAKAHLHLSRRRQESQT